MPVQPNLIPRHAPNPPRAMTASGTEQPNLIPWQAPNPPRAVSRCPPGTLGPAVPGQPNLIPWQAPNPPRAKTASSSGQPNLQSAYQAVASYRRRRLSRSIREERKVAAMPSFCSALRLVLPPGQSASESKQTQAGRRSRLASLHLGDAAAAGAAPGERESGFECPRPRCKAIVLRLMPAAYPQQRKALKPACLDMSKAKCEHDGAV